MKNVLLLLFSLISAFSFAQKTDVLKAFEALDSNIGANINIVKSSEYKVLFSGNTQKLKHINWVVNDSSLNIRTNNKTISFEDVMLTVYTPSLGVLKVSDGGKAIMDASFARLDKFEVIATGDAIVDLSRIEFITLTANSKNGAQIIYDDPGTPF